MLDVPLALLVGYVEEQDVYEWPVAECCDDALSDMDQIRPEDVPVGDSTEDVERRRFIISMCYRDWKLRNPSMRKFNLSLNEDINIRFDYRDLYSCFKNLLVNVSCLAVGCYIDKCKGSVYMP